MTLQQPAVFSVAPQKAGRYPLPFWVAGAALLLCTALLLWPWRPSLYDIVGLVLIGGTVPAAILTLGVYALLFQKLSLSHRASDSIAVATGGALLALLWSYVTAAFTFGRVSGQAFQLSWQNLSGGAIVATTLAIVTLTLFGVPFWILRRLKLSLLASFAIAVAAAVALLFLLVPSVELLFDAFGRLNVAGL